MGVGIEDGCRALSGMIGPPKSDVTFSGALSAFSGLPPVFKAVPSLLCVHDLLLHRMQEKGTSRAWTQEEDDLLVQVMNRNGGFENWKEVATLIPGRTNKACRKVCLPAVLFVGPY